MGVEVDRLRQLADRPQKQRRSGRWRRSRRGSRPGARVPSAGRALRLRLTRATQTPAIGPKSGPTTIARDDQDRLVEVDPDRGDQHRQGHEDQVAVGELDVLGGARGDVLPDDRIGAEVVAPATMASSSMPEISASMFSIAIEPSTSTLSSRRSATSRLTSLRATSQRTRSPVRLRGDVREVDDVEDRVGRLEQLEHVVALGVRRDDPQMNHGRIVVREALSAPCSQVPVVRPMRVTSELCAVV